MTEEHAAYELVMRFVVCAGEGGPYDDAAFVAGVRWGRLDAQMERRSDAEIRLYAEPALVPQIDLSAMRYGYTMTSEPWDEHPDEWTLVTLTRSAG